MIAMTVNEIDRRARVWAEALGSAAKVVDGESMIGGGSLPGSTLPTRLVAIGSLPGSTRPTKLVAIGGRRKGQSVAQSLARRLRESSVPIIGRISEDVLLLDPRSVLPEEDGIVIQVLQKLELL